MATEINLTGYSIAECEEIRVMLASVARSLVHYTKTVTPVINRKKIDLAHQTISFTNDYACLLGCPKNNTAAGIEEYWTDLTRHLFEQTERRRISATYAQQLEELNPSLADPNSDLSSPAVQQSFERLRNEAAFYFAPSLVRDRITNVAQAFKVSRPDHVHNTLSAWEAIILSSLPQSMRGESWRTLTTKAKLGIPGLEGPDDRVQKLLEARGSFLKTLFEQFKKDRTAFFSSVYMMQKTEWDEWYPAVDAALQNTITDQIKEKSEKASKWHSEFSALADKLQEPLATLLEDPHPVVQEYWDRGLRLSKEYDKASEKETCTMALMDHYNAGQHLLRAHSYLLGGLQSRLEMGVKGIEGIDNVTKWMRQYRSNLSHQVWLLNDINKVIEYTLEVKPDNSVIIPPKMLDTAPEDVELAEELSKVGSTGKLSLNECFRWFDQYVDTNCATGKTDSIARPGAGNTQDDLETLSKAPQVPEWAAAQDHTRHRSF